MTAPLAICVALQARGVASQEAQAEALGLLRPQWNKYLKGRMSPSIDRVQDWGIRLGLRLTFDPSSGWTAEGAACSTH